MTRQLRIIPGILAATFLTLGTMAPYVAAQEFYFPHYADGSGLSMQITITNSSATPASGALEVFSPSGAPSSLPGIGSHVDLSLAPNETRVFESGGGSFPLRTGFIKVETNSREVSGLAIFKLAGGQEASVLPAQLGDRFTLFVERGADLNSGVAVVRSDSGQEISAMLFNKAGNLVESLPFPIDGLQDAKTLGEIFPSTEGDFVGSVELRCGMADCKFAPLGLRFGQVLSTIAVTDLTEREMTGGGTPISEGLSAIRRMVNPSGYWFFAFAIGSSNFDDEYAFFQALELNDPESEIPFQAVGVDGLFDVVIAAYLQDSEEYLLYDQGFIFDTVYIFTFEDDDHVSGCFHMADPDTGSLGSCRPAEGLRFDFEDIQTTSLRAAKAVHSPEANERRMRELFQREKFSPPSPEVARVLRALRGRLQAERK